MMSVEERDPQSLKIDTFLDPNYGHRGSILQLHDHTEFYSVGSAQSKQGIIVVPDTLGWNSGRIRNIADFFAQNGSLAVIPKISGSSDNAPSAQSFFAAESIGEYLKSLTFDAHLKPKIVSLINFLHEEGIDKIAIIGFNWGGWVVSNILASDLANQFVCGALPHPSINLEERVYGGNLLELMSRINRPLLLMPARGDPDDYRLILKLLKYKLPSSDIIDYHNVEHGFLLRGNISDAEIKEACQKSLSEIWSYFQHHFRMDVNDLVHDASQGRGFTREEWQPDKGLLERTKETGERVVERVQQGASSLTERAKETFQVVGHTFGEKLKQVGDLVHVGTDKTVETGEYVTGSVGERVGQATEVIQDKTQQSMEYAKETGKSVADRASSVGQSVGEGTQQVLGKVGDTAEQTYDKAKENVIYLGDQARETYDHTKDTATQYYDKAKDTAGTFADKVKQTGHDASQRASDTYEQTKDTAGQYYDKAKENVSETYDKAKDTAGKYYDWAKDSAGQTYEKAKDTAGQTKETVGQYYDTAKDKAGETYEQTKDTAGQYYDNAKENVGETYDKAKDTASEYYDKTRDTAGEYYDKAKDAAGQTYEQTKNKAGETYEKAKDTAGDMSERAKQTGQQVGQKAQETYDKSKDTAGQSYDRSKDSTWEAYEKSKQQPHDDEKIWSKDNVNKVQQNPPGSKFHYDLPRQQVPTSSAPSSSHPKSFHSGPSNDSTASGRGQESVTGKAKQSASNAGQQFGEKMKQTGETIKQKSK